MESHRPAWGEGESWRLAGTPSLDLTATGTGEPHRFSGTVGAVRLPDGGIAVADAGSRQLRIYDASGAFRTVWPPPSDTAPHVEITSLDVTAGDSLLVLDAATPALFLLSPAGELARSVPLEGGAGLPLSRAHDLEDGRVLVRSGWSPAQVGAAGTGLIRPALPFLVFGGGGALLDTALVAPGDALVLIRIGPAGAFVPPVLGPVTVSDVHAGSLYVGTGERFEILVYDPAGGLETILRAAAADTTVTADELALARSDWSAMERGNPVAARILAQVERSVPPPTRRPAYGSLLVDREGAVWVGAYPWGGPGSGGARRPTTFTVLDREGRWLGEVQVPEGFEPTDIGPDWVLGILRAGASESVRLYALERRASPPGGEGNAREGA